MKSLMAAVLALAIFAGSALAELRITHNVTGAPCRVEVIDQQNKQAKSTFDMNSRDNKSLDITGTRVMVNVFEKGTNQLRCSGTFPSNAQLTIEAQGTNWQIRQTAGNSNQPQPQKRR